MEVGIFCKIIDNFGDAGFCLRLARGLASKVEVVRIYCDDLKLLKKMYEVNEHFDLSMPKNIHILNYDRETTKKKIYSENLIIEAFQAQPPLNFLKQIHSSPNVKRVIIDHLITESWADSFQNKKAPDYKLLSFFSGVNWENSTSAKRLWLAPGFTGKSAGLITNGWRNINQRLRDDFRKRILSSKETKIKKNNRDLGSVFIICIFLYENFDTYFDCPVPEGFDSLALWQPKSIVMSQIEFDCALQSCDFNYVRGEDSFISAHNAAASDWKVPFAWQPYWEKNEGHIKKFLGWKKLFYNDKFDSYWEFAMLVAERNNINFIGKWKKFILDWDAFKSSFHVVCLNKIKQRSLEQSILDCINVN